VKSYRGAQFRIWATQRLHEYIMKGFVLDDERLKPQGEGNYFEGLLQRIRDIRSSEKVFFYVIKDIARPHTLTLRKHLFIGAVLCQFQLTLVLTR